MKVIALFVFFILTYIPQYLTELTASNEMNEFFGWIVYYLIYVLSCCFTSLAMLTSFKALIKMESPIWNSISANAYLIYLCHFPFIVWTQFLLMSLELHAVIKFGITFSVSFFFSWGLSILLRKNNFIRNYV